MDISPTRSTGTRAIDRHGTYNVAGLQWLTPITTDVPTRSRAL